jgi:hypothetical protein
MLHALLACSAFATERAAMWAELQAEVGAAVASAARDMPADRQLAALLGDAQWGDHALAVDGLVRGFLIMQFRRRQRAGGAGGGGGWRRVRPGSCGMPGVPCPERCGFDVVVRWVRSGLSHALPRARTAWRACWRLVLP